MPSYLEDIYDDFEDYEEFSESEHDYEELRILLAPEYADLPPEELEELFEQTLGMYPEDVEDFLKDLGRGLRSVGKAVAPALPAVGTVVGTAFGGPVGGAVGGIAGRAAGGALTPQRPPRRPVRRPRSVSPPPQPPIAPAAPATAQLLQVLARPEVLQALMSMLLGPSGRRHVPVAGTPVPVGAFTNLLGVLANRAAAEYNVLAAPSGEDIPRYLLDVNGEFLVDPAVPEERAAVLLGLLEIAEQEEAAYELYEAELAEEFEDDLGSFAEDVLDLMDAYFDED